MQRCAAGDDGSASWCVWESIAPVLPGSVRARFSARRVRVKPSYVLSRSDALPAPHRLTVLHTADWHLGRRFPAFDAESERKLRRARMSVIDRIFDVATHHRVDAVICAGDLFDDPTPDEDWWRGLAQRLVARQGERGPIVLLPGNHDPLLARSIYAEDHPFRRSLPDDVHIVDRDDFTLSLGERAVLYGAPCRSKAGQRRLCDALPSRDPGDERVRIGLIHGQTLDIEGCETNFPIDVDVVKRAGLDYLALGDTHALRVMSVDGVPAVYPGAPEATSFKENDTGHVVLVSFDGDTRRADLTPVRVGQWRWLERHVTSLPALQALVADPALHTTVLRACIDMELPPAEYGIAETLLRRLCGDDVTDGRAGIASIDIRRLRLRPSGDDLTELPEIARRVFERLSSLESSPQRDVARKAVELLFRVAEGER